MNAIKIGLALIALAIVIQLVPFGRDHENPSVRAEPNWDNPKTRELFDRACADCHSHRTKWPWYSNVAPVSWLVQHDVEEGREHFNVSLWGIQEKNEGNEAVESIEKGEMPMKTYVLLHPEANLSAEELKVLVAGLRATFGEKKEEGEASENSTHESHEHGE